MPINYVGRADAIKKSLGIHAAAGYLRNNGHSLEQALFILIGVSK